VTESAGILAWRRGAHGVELFLVHPGGPFWKNKDVHAWSIPKGELDAGDDDLLAAARREFREETGQTIEDAAAAVALPATRHGGKTIHAFAVECPAGGGPDPDRLASNDFELEWPPRSGRRQRFPEVDRADWVPLTEATDRLHRNQRALVDHLRAVIDAERD
jgi:predicted NUDIX family NTP pyrophosphohydrolase